jgi:hypothetical protein
MPLPLGALLGQDVIPVPLAALVTAAPVFSEPLGGPAIGLQFRHFAISF